MVPSNMETSQKKVKKEESYSSLKIGLMGAWGFRNMGNVSHQVAMIENIRKYQPNAQICGFAAYPEITQRIHSIPCFTFSRQSDNAWLEGSEKNFFTKNLSKFHAKIRIISNPILKKLLIPIRILVGFILEIFALIRSFRILKDFDMLIITGACHFIDLYGGARALPYAVYVWGLIARLRNVNFLVVSNGVGPINEPLSKFFCKQALSFASYRSYRDDYSKQYVEKVLDFDVKDDPVYPDLSFSLDLTRYQTNIQPRSESKTVVGIAPTLHLAAGGFPGSSGGQTHTYPTYLAKLASFASWLLESQYTIFFFVSDFRTDGKVIQDLKQVLKKNKIYYSEGQIIEQTIPIVDDESTFDKFMTQLAETDLVVACRFHGVLLSQFLNKPTIALSFGKKTDCLMADMSQSEYCLSIDQFDVEVLKDKLITLEANQEIIRTQLAKRSEYYREALDEQYAHLFSNL